MSCSPTYKGGVYTGRFATPICTADSQCTFFTRICRRVGGSHRLVSRLTEHGIWHGRHGHVDVNKWNSGHRCDKNQQHVTLTTLLQICAMLLQVFESLSKTCNALQSCKHRKKSSTTSYHCKLALQINQCNTTLTGGNSMGHVNNNMNTECKLFFAFSIFIVCSTPGGVL